MSDKEQGGLVCSRCGPGDHGNDACPRAAAEAMNDTAAGLTGPDAMDAYWADVAEELLNAEKDKAKLDNIEEGKDPESRVELVEDLVREFERKHDLEYLHGLVLRTEAKGDPMRELAKADLGPMVAELKALEKDGRSTPEQVARARASYSIASKAVGMLNVITGLCRHDL